ncbi:hypothetical protein, partial [Ralstonia pseudosolanacearum]
RAAHHRGDMRVRRFAASAQARAHANGSQHRQGAQQGMSRAQATRAGTTVAYGHGNPPKAADREARASRSA